MKQFENSLFTGYHASEYILELLAESHLVGLLRMSQGITAKVPFRAGSCRRLFRFGSIRGVSFVRSSSLSSQFGCRGRP
jgi:hypothetical protein